MSAKVCVFVLSVVLAIIAVQAAVIPTYQGNALTCQGGSLQFVPNPDSCTSFYHCSNGVPNLKECPAGLLWDAKWTTCNYPADVECSADSGKSEPTTTVGPVRTTTQAAETTTTTQKASQTTTEAAVTTQPAKTTTTTTTTKATPPTTTTAAQTPPNGGDFTCSASIEFRYFPHPDTCTKFYLCASGTSSGPYNCGNDLWFSSSLQACVRPNQSDCKLGA